MQNEILRPVLETDEVAVPRYDLVSANGQVLQQNVELRLKNEVVQQGTPYSAEAVLPNELAEQLGLPTSATPADAFAAVIAKSGSKVSMNEPTAQDNIEAGYSIGSLWLRTYFSIVNRAYDVSASDFTAIACSFSKSGQVFTVAGNGDDKVISVSGSMLADGWLYAVITPDATASSVRLVQGDKTVQLAVGERNVVCIDYMGADFLIEATYDTANIAASSSIVIENLTIISKYATYTSNVYANSDLTVDSLLSICNQEAPFNEIMLPVKVFQHVSDGVWELIYGITDATRELLELSYDASPDKALALIANKPEIALLWENASPTSAFSAQTITIKDLLQYDMLAIQTYSPEITHTNVSATVVIPARQCMHLCSTKTLVAGITTNFSMTDLSMVYGASGSYKAVYDIKQYRLATLNTAGSISFATAWYAAGRQSTNDATYARDHSVSTNNGAMVPVLIYGIKGVLV